MVELYSIILVESHAKLGDYPMKRILYILPYVALGGTEKHVYTVMKALKDRFDVSLLAPTGPGSREFEELGVKYHKLLDESHSIGKRLREFRGVLRTICEETPPDLIHVHAGHELVILSKLAVREFPILFTVHGYAGKSSNIDYFLSAKISRKWADRVIVVSQSEKMRLVNKGLQPEKIRLVYNGTPPIQPVSAEVLRKRLGIPQDSIVIGTIGRLEEPKGFQYLLQAYAILLHKHRNSRVVIIGSGGFSTQLFTLAKELDIAEHVVFPGYIQDARNYMPVFDIFVLPSLAEALPLVLVEAMSAGKPLIGTTVGGIPEIIEHEYNGLLCEPASVESLAEAMARLLEEATLRKEYGIRAKQLYDRCFTSDAMISNTAEVYEELFASKD